MFLFYALWLSESARCSENLTKNLSIFLFQPQELTNLHFRQLWAVRSATASYIWVEDTFSIRDESLGRSPGKSARTLESLLSAVWDNVVRANCNYASVTVWLGHDVGDYLRAEVHAFCRAYIYICMNIYTSTARLAERRLLSGRGFN